MQEDQVLLPFARLEAGICRARQFGGERGEFVIVRGENGAAAGLFVQVLDSGPGDGKTVPGGRAAADFIEDDETFGGRLVQDRGGFDHLDHEGGAPAREIIRGADPGEDAVGQAEAQ